MAVDVVDVVAVLDTDAVGVTKDVRGEDDCLRARATCWRGVA